MTARPIVTDPDVGIPDLVRRLSEDSRRLVTDEVQLAKLETSESVHRAMRGTLWLTLAFGAAVVMLVALTILLITLLGRLDNGHIWFGAIVTGVLELAVGGARLTRSRRSRIADARRRGTGAARRAFRR